MRFKDIRKIIFNDDDERLLLKTRALLSDIFIGADNDDISFIANDGIYIIDVLLSDHYSDREEE